MIKYLFIVINSLAVFLFSLFSDDGGITVTGTIPASIKAGQETVIELKINKGNMAGFAKLQMELPEGIAAKETENKGANYTYNGGIAKWVWASLPPEKEITIKVTLISSAEAVGLKTIIAKFSFVENNAKQVVEMTPAEINIIAADSANAVTTTSPLTTESPVASETPVITETPVSAPPADSTSVANVSVNQNTTSASNNEPPGNVTIERTITKGNSENERIVNIKIKKGATKGFARYSDELADGIIVKATKTDGSSFSVGDGKLKFVWVTVPAKDILELEYTMSANISEPTMVTLNEGEYSYLEDNQSKKVTLAGAGVRLLPEKQAAAIAKEEPAVAKTETKVNDTPVPEKPVVEKTVVENTDNSSATTQKKMEQTLSKKEGQVNYHVQIGAFTKASVNADKLKKIFHVTESITSEMQGGFSKFMVGSHEEYKGARDHREEMKNNNGIKSSFVVAYNGGKRITVQEALMISNQKWFK